MQRQQSTQHYTPIDEGVAVSEVQEEVGEGRLRIGACAVDIVGHSADGVAEPGVAKIPTGHVSACSEQRGP